MLVRTLRLLDTFTTRRATGLYNWVQTDYSPTKHFNPWLLLLHL